VGEDIVRHGLAAGVRFAVLGKRVRVWFDKEYCRQKLVPTILDCPAFYVTCEQNRKSLSQLHTAAQANIRTLERKLLAAIAGFRNQNAVRIHTPSNFSCNETHQI
jgi:hypothetical protein